MQVNKIVHFMLITIITLVGIFLFTNKVNAETTNNYNIAIDGSFDDWVDKPKTDIFFDYNNGNVTKQGSFLSDGQYLYIYIDMDPYNKGHNYRFQGSGWNIQVGNNITSLSFTVDGGIWSLQAGQKAAIKSVWSWSNQNPDQIFINQEIAGATGFVASEKSSNGWAYHDRAEIKIPLNGFLKNPDIVQSMTIYDTDNMGQQKITIAGADTGSSMIVLSGFFLAIAVLLIGKLKKSKKERSLT